MSQVYYDPYGIFPSPKPNRRRRSDSINTFDAIGGDNPSIWCRLGESGMEYLFSVDNAITEYIASMASEWSHSGGLFRPMAKIMEWSMHGLIWLIGIILAIHATGNRVENRAAAHLLINLLFALLFDLVVIGVLKLIFRRRRPRGNPGNMIAEAPYVDQFSFPSGHSSRAAMLTKLLVILLAMDTKTKLFIQRPMVLEVEEMQEADSRKPDVQVVSSGTELIQNIYNVLERSLGSCRRAKQSQFIVGLSGGSLIKTLTDVLPSLNEEHLKSVRFIFCDERRVPFDDPESTYGEYMKLVYPRLQPIVSAEQFIGINPSLPVNECATDYEQKLRILMSSDAEWPEFDVLFVGLGPDGHTCSLFPGHPVVQEHGRWVAPVSDSPKPPPERVTMTLPVLNHARRVVFVATGAGKADVVKQILEGSAEEKGRFPAAMVKTVRRCSSVIWILDKEAASKLTNIPSKA